MRPAFRAAVGEHRDARPVGGVDGVGGLIPLDRSTPGDPTLQAALVGFVGIVGVGRVHALGPETVVGGDFIERVLVEWRQSRTLRTPPLRRLAHENGWIIAGPVALGAIEIV
jgi:hypothetical protein